MEKRYIIGIDQSTQGTKALLFDGVGHLLRRTDLATADTGSSVSSSKRQAAFTRKSVIYCAGESPSYSMKARYSVARLTPTKSVAFSTPIPRV